jgi:hypothetical protein
MIMKTLMIFLAFNLVILSSSIAQEEQKEKYSRQERLEIYDTLSPNSEKAYDFFAAAGASYRFGDLYNVTISQIDYTVQFEKVYPIMTRFSLGFVWNPFPDKSDNSIKNMLRKKEAKLAYEAARNVFAVALLVNVFQLGFTATDFDISTPIDVGFGAGYKKSNFLALLTVEFTPMRTPREYFVNDYKGKDLQLIYDGATEPARTVSVDDNTLYTDKVFICLGLKLAYAFGKKKNEIESKQ